MLYDGLKIEADHNPSIYPSNSTTIGETRLVRYGSNMLQPIYELIAVYGRAKLGNVFYISKACNRISL